MRLLVGMLVGTLTTCGVASALVTPVRSVTAPAAVTALSVTNRSVVYAVGPTGTNCASVELWESPRSRLRFGETTLLGCEEGPSGGFGISAVSVAGLRVFWLTHIGGNITDWRLWTATRTRKRPRLLASASAETDGPAPVLLGHGTTGGGTPYAVGDTVTYVSATGARLFRISLASPVRLLAAGPAPGRTTRVVAGLADGRIVLLSEQGEVIRTDLHAPGAATAIGLGVKGPVVQVGTTVTVGRATFELPGGARMLDYARAAIVYRRGAEIRLRSTVTGADRLLQRIRARPGAPVLFAGDHVGPVWTTGRTVYGGAWPVD